jgi:aspartate aminotransferase-like enzyme
MKAFPSKSLSDNPKPVRSHAEGSPIQSSKWLALSVMAVVLTVAAAVAQAQQTGKVFRIGFLDSSTASATAGLLEAFRQELRQAWLD